MGIVHADERGVAVQAISKGEIMISHSAVSGGADKVGVLGQHAASEAGLGGFPFFPASGDGFGGNIQRERAFLGVDDERVTFIDQRERAAAIGFRSDVADDKSVSAAGETPVGDERDILAEAAAHDGARGAEHFAHARAALRAFVADDDDIARDDAAGKDRFHRGFFGVKHPRAAGEGEPLLAADLCHGAFGGKVAVKDDEVAVFFDGVIERANDVLTGDVGFHGLQILSHRAAGDREAIAVQETGDEQGLHHRLDAADGDERGHHVFAGGFEIGEDGDALADACEIIDRKFDASRLCHGEQVQHGVGGTAECDDDGDGIFKRLSRHDVARSDAELQKIHHGGTGTAGVVLLGTGNGILRGAVGQRHAQRFDGAGHGVGGVHAATGTGAGNGTGFNLVQFGVGDFLVGMRAHGFKHRHDVERALSGGEAAGQDGAAVNEDGGAVHPRHGHDAGGHVLVAAADGHKAIHALAADDRFDGVGNHLARDERVFHPLGAHRDAVGDRDGVKYDGLAAGGIGPGLRFDGQFVDVHVARGDIAPGRGDADEGLGEILLLEADGIQHGATRRAVGAVQQNAGVRSQVGFAFGLFHFTRGIVSVSCIGSKQKRAERLTVGEDSVRFKRSLRGRTGFDRRNAPEAACRGWFVGLVKIPNQNLKANEELALAA